MAAELARLEEYRISELPVMKDPLQEFMAQLQGSGQASILKREFGVYYPIVEYLRSIHETKGVQARLPFEMIIE